MEKRCFSFFYPGKILMGIGSLEAVGKEAVCFGNKAVLVTGKSSMRRTGILDKVKNVLHASGIEVWVFEGIEPEPSWQTVEETVSFVKSKRPQFVVGIGGGSVIDVAKAVAGLANKDSVTAYKEGKTIEYEGLPFVAIPSTSGTGAEVTPNAVLTNKGKNQKKSLRSPLLFSKLAVVDPLLTVSCPADITAYSGIDALCQAVESFISRGANPLTDALCMKAISLISDNLVRAYVNGEDMKAREALAYGSLLAGLALANARLGVIHGIAHALGVKYGLSHGLVVGLLFPHALEFNLPYTERREKYMYIASAVGKRKIAEIVPWIIDLLGKLGFPKSLREVGVKEKDFTWIASQSMPSGSLKANPKEVSEEDVVGILRKSF
jgi:alcohol dehydrogenase class IV